MNRNLPHPFRAALVFALGAACGAAAESRPAATVQVLRDRFGVPHIYAESLADAAFAQGYCHAEDNLGPLLATYREARALSARTFGGGRREIENDFTLLKFDLPGLSRRAYERMDPAGRAIVEAYAAGVDRFATENPARRPAWYEPVTGQDVVSAMKAFQLRETIAVARADLAAVPRSRRERDQAADPGSLSNMWAIRPERMRGGETLLLSDPHLPWHGAVQWHESHLVVGDRWIYGATFFGFPGIAIGFTQDLAWGITNNGADNADVYRVELDPADPTRYRHEGAWRPVVAKVLAIEARGVDGTLARIERTVRFTHHGPILEADEKRGVAFAARLAGLERGNPAAWADYFAARNLRDLEASFDRDAPTKNHRVVADRHGDIGYYYFGAAHRRSDAVTWSAPVDGGVAATEWGPPLTWREMPHVVNPAAGLIVNRNNNAYMIAPDRPLKPADYPRHLMDRSTVLRPTMRAHRAMELLAAKPQLDLAECEAAAMDVKVLTAGRYTDAIVRAGAGGDARLARAAEIVAGWDRMATAENTVLPLVAAFRESVVAGGDDARLDRLAPERVRGHVAAALALLGKRWGRTDVAWGEVHRMRRGEKELPIAGAGSERAADPSTTLFMAGAGKADDGRYFADLGSSWLQMVTYRDGAVAAKTGLPFGNSNDPASPDHADQMEFFASRRLKSALLARAEIETGPVRATTLRAAAR